MGRQMTVEEYLSWLEYGLCSSHSGCGYYYDFAGNRVRHVHYYRKDVLRYCKAHPEIAYIIWYRN